MIPRLITTKKIRSIVKHAADRYGVTIEGTKVRQYRLYNWEVKTHGPLVRKIEYKLKGDRDRIIETINQIDTILTLSDSYKIQRGTFWSNDHRFSIMATLEK